MKTVLILVVSSQLHPYMDMFYTSIETWDSVHVEGVDTRFYFGAPVQPTGARTIYFDYPECYANMGHKMLAAFEWVLKYHSFDYIARVNSSTYVDKKELLKHIQTLPDTDLFSCIKVVAGEIYKEDWSWGATGFIISRDVIQKIVKHKFYWRHDLMEDVAIGYLINKLGIPYHPGTACSIDKMENGWRCLCYGTESFEFSDFSEMIKAKGQFFFRCKYDSDRTVDKYIMEQLFKYLP